MPFVFGIFRSSKLTFGSRDTRSLHKLRVGSRNSSLTRVREGLEEVAP